MNEADGKFGLDPSRLISGSRSFDRLDGGLQSALCGRWLSGQSSRTRL